MGGGHKKFDLLGLGHELVHSSAQGCLHSDAADAFCILDGPVCVDDVVVPQLREDVGLIPQQRTRQP